MALTPRAFASFVTTDARLACRIPDDWSELEAATMPLVFQTVYYALRHVARIKRGDRVLIHAGAGGVGLAAVQVAQHAGAEIFATAGSEPKRAMLRELGIPHVASSRTLEFADLFRAAAGGSGMDIVLNSLAGSFIDESLKLLRPGGYFLELGKTDLWTPERVASIAPGVRYVPVYLGDVCAREPEKIRQIYDEMLADVAAGATRPLPRRVMPVDRAPDAFRFMAQARHTGKIVVSQRVVDCDRLDQGGSYIVTGAFGGIGFAVARWLVAREARHVYLLGRRLPTDRPLLDDIEVLRRDAAVHCRAVDVADHRALSGLLAEIAGSGAPLRGVVHAAGVLDDGVLVGQTAERFARVMAPKVRGAWNLHRLTTQLDLDFFVLCSSGAALFGAAGQSNYAAANAFLDSLAHARRAQGLPALSVNWGPWLGRGMAAAVSERQRDDWHRQGMGSIDPRQGIAALDALLDADLAQAAVLPVNWPRYLEGVRGMRVPAFLSRVADGAGQDRDGDGSVSSTGQFASMLAQAGPSERPDLLQQHVQSVVAHVLGRRAPTLPVDIDFTSLGLDSLMSVELGNRLTQTLGQAMPATLAFEHPTIEALTRHLLSVMFERETFEM